MQTMCLKKQAGLLFDLQVMQKIPTFNQHQSGKANFLVFGIRLALVGKGKTRNQEKCAFGNSIGS